MVSALDCSSNPCTDARSTVLSRRSIVGRVLPHKARRVEARIKNSPNRNLAAGPTFAFAHFLSDYFSVASSHLETRYVRRYHIHRAAIDGGHDFRRSRFPPLNSHPLDFKVRCGVLSLPPVTSRTSWTARANNDRERTDSTNGQLLFARFLASSPVNDVSDVPSSPL